MGFIKVENGFHSLTESGWQFVLEHPPELIAIQEREIKQQEQQRLETTQRNFAPFEAANKVTSLRQAYARAGAFRAIVTAQYEYYCAVCGLKLATLEGAHLAEAAHSILKHKPGADDPRNGFCLCRNCHWAINAGIISVRPQSLTIMIASYLGRLEQSRTA
jgi:predicted restriction endonuclease